MSIGNSGSVGRGKTMTEIEKQKALHGAGGERRVRQFFQDVSVTYHFTGFLSFQPSVLQGH